MKIAVRLQVLGALLVSVAGALVHPVAGFTVAGVLALAFGVALERQALVVPPGDVDGDG